MIALAGRQSPVDAHIRYRLLHPGGGPREHVLTSPATIARWKSPGLLRARSGASKIRL